MADIGRKKPATEGASSLEGFSLSWIVMASELPPEAAAPVISAVNPFAGINKLGTCDTMKR